MFDLKTLFYPITLLLTKTRVKFKIQVFCPYKINTQKPIIFAVNHTNSFDTPVAGAAIWKICRKRCKVLAGKQSLWLSDRLFFWLNGVIWVDRKSREAMKNTKQKLITLLQQKQNIMWFPEGTWNMTDNLFMLPMKWGIIDAAAASGAQIIPLILEYDRETMVASVYFGTPMDSFESADKASCIASLRDAMATIRWEHMNKKDPVSRNSISIEEERQRIRKSLDEYPPLDWEYESSIIFRPYDDRDKVFSWMDQSVPAFQNAFLWREYFLKKR